MNNVKEFQKKYAKFFAERFVYSTAEVEKSDDKQIKKEQIACVLKAYKYLLEKPSSERLTIKDIKTVGDIVNFDSDTAPGFRRIDVNPGLKANFTPSDPKNILNKLNQLLINYYYMWEGIDPFLKEAMFHITYMRIHPFEDGNKRSAKLITTINLLKEGIPPVIITKEDTDEYYEFINNRDYNGFAEFLKQRSNLEDNTMIGFYKIVENISPLEEVDNNRIRKILQKSVK